MKIIYFVFTKNVEVQKWIFKSCRIYVVVDQKFIQDISKINNNEFPSKNNVKHWKLVKKS